MTEGRVMSWAVAGLLGLLVGACFYGGLWWTVRRALHSPRAALWFASSLAVRTLVALAGFYAIGGLQWQRMGMCLLGFLVARPLVARLVARRSRPAADATATATAANL